MRRQHVVVLIETGQVLLLPARDAERAITKNTLAVDQVTDNLANAPLAFTIAERFLMRFNSLEQNIQLVHLRTQHGQNVRLADLIDVALKIGCVLSLRWSIHPKHLLGRGSRIILRVSRPCNVIAWFKDASAQRLAYQ